MATKIEGLELKVVSRVWFAGEWINIKKESLKEETNGYFFEDLSGNKYWSSIIAVSNIAQIEPY